MTNLQGSVYQHYVYSYPHKTAYRKLSPPIPLRQLWQSENLDSLFLYLHVPFCEFRCGFCNLFTRALPPEELAERYLAQLQREADVVKNEVGKPKIARMAIGGGTPTYLDERQLERLFAIARTFGAEPQDNGCSIECSPDTLSASKLKLLIDQGIERISIGVQSFSLATSKSLGRPQVLEKTEAALDLLRASPLPILNVDLIYGAEGQTTADFVGSINRLLEWEPDEVFIYPLYVRPLTGLGKKRDREVSLDWDSQRLDCYRAGRDRLLEAGFEQQSMRMFARKRANHSTQYSCQSDGMIGLGCGARSYTRTVHYSTEYAVGRNAVHEILDSYIERRPSEFAEAHHGYKLTSDEQMRRYTLMSLLHVAGLDLEAFREKFDRQAFDVMPLLGSLIDESLVDVEDNRLRLTRIGLERSDQIGPLLFSSEVRQGMESYSCV